ncbi:hypothetical protein IAD21_04386 [Abditibacteriota bacterium]|nr:hypothetical protein IAD21_04386 [Abditibacteriota bacterium]
MIHWVEVRWRPRAEPLEPVAVVATGSAARALAKRLLELPDDELKRLRGVSWNEGLALEGESQNLPWADGASYLGHDARAPKLLLPCALEPDAPLDLWARAFERQLKRELVAPLAILPQNNLAISLAGGRSLERAKLEVWLQTSKLTPN